MSKNSIISSAGGKSDQTGSVHTPSSKAMVHRSPMGFPGINSDWEEIQKIFQAMNMGVFITDAQGRTNVPGVYAIGDANGVWMLAHAAYR